MYKITLVNEGKSTVIHHPHFNHLKTQDGKMVEGINSVPTFKFSLLPHNPGYEIVRPLRTLIQIQNMKNQQLIFEGRVLMPTNTMNENGSFQKTFLCEGELGYLYDSTQRWGDYREVDVRRFLGVMLDNHNKDVTADKHFEVGVVNVPTNNETDGLYRYLGYDSTLDTIFDKLINRLGGELKVRKANGVRYLDYLVEDSRVCQTEIRLAKNLKSIREEIDPSSIITRLIPLGTQLEEEADEDEPTAVSLPRLTIASVNGGRDFIDDVEAIREFGVIAKSETFDDITIASNLLTRGREFLADNNRVRVQYTVTALDLSLIGLDTDSFEVGNYYPVINPVMGLNKLLRVVGKEIDIVNPENNRIIIGDVFKTLSQYQSDLQRGNEAVIGLESMVTSHSKQIASVSRSANQAQQSVNELQKAFEEVDIDSVKGFDEFKNEVMNQLDKLSSNLTGIGGEVTDLSNQLMLHTADFNAYKNEQSFAIARINERLDQLERRDKDDE